MNGFTADYSSSPALAEDIPPRRNRLFSNMPALASTTPLVPPPSTLFDSSRVGSGVSKLQFSKGSTIKPLATPGRPFHSSSMDPYEEDQEYKPTPSLINFNTPPRSTKPTRLPRRGTNTLLPQLARDLGARLKPAPLEHDDTLLLDTEQILQLEPIQTDELIALWQTYIEPTIDSTTIGPLPSASSFTKANYLASLLLAIYQDNNPVPTPQIILDWLDNYHVSYEPLYRAVASTSPNVTSHELFWDAIQSLTLRGKLAEVTRLLAEADFKYAASAVDDGEEESGYHGAQLQTIQSVVYRARQVLNSCPASDSANWNTISADWDMFRRQLDSELDGLTVLAADDADEFHAENFGLHLSQLGRSNPKSNASLPWTVYQGLKVMYSILRGSAEEIIAQSQDWLEASSALTVWWDGNEDAKIVQWSFDVSRAMQDSIQHPNPYLTRLHDAFLCVTDPDDKNSFPINALSPVEIGLASILQGNLQDVLVILRALSQCAASAVAEVASSAGWFKTLSDLNQADLLVLNYGITKDEILLSYADALFERGQLHAADGHLVQSWELSISVLTRLDNAETMQTTISNLLDKLQLTDQEHVQRLINLCSDLGLLEEAQKVSERFGDHLVHNTTDYGTALLCYARAHTSHKVRQLIDLLVSYCLVQSKAYPDENKMDPALRGLVGHPKSAFLDIAEVDPEAAAILQFHVAGYACLRKFYDLRDGELLQPLARKRAAAKALIAVINSAADCIYGGLYDENRESAIQVDGLLTLLGEATALLSDTITFSSEQMYALLAAIEDLQTVSTRVYNAAEECLQASLRNYNGSLPPSPHTMLKKSMSSGTNSNFSFSMMGSEMLGESLGGNSIGSAILVAAQTTRGWDWRTKFKDSHTGADVLKYLRTGIAKEVV